MEMALVGERNVVVASILASLVGIRLGLGLLVPIRAMIARDTKDDTRETKDGADRRIELRWSREGFRAKVRRLAELTPRGGTVGSRVGKAYGSSNR